LNENVISYQKKKANICEKQKLKFHHKITVETGQSTSPKGSLLQVKYEILGMEK